MTSKSVTPSSTLALPVDQRPVLPLPGIDANGWRMKMYGIAYERDEPREDLVAATRQLARDTLPQPVHDEGRHGTGFVIAHDGALGRWALMFWWSNNVWLHERLYHSPVDSPHLDLRPVESGLLGCLWELQVIDWERQAWLRYLHNGGGDLQTYLADQIAHPQLVH
ncbi:hypothetical protein ACWDSD_32475 [Streptomyces spiralis]